METKKLTYLVQKKYLWKEIRTG